MNMQVTLNALVRKHSGLVAELITPRQRRALTAFLHQSSEHNPEYAPASGEIFGLLKQMKEGFETNLASSQKEEMLSQADYESLKKSKEEEIAAGNKQIETKSEELGDAEEKKALSKQDLEDTTNTMNT